MPVGDRRYVTFDCARGVCFPTGLLIKRLVLIQTVSVVKWFIFRLLSFYYAVIILYRILIVAHWVENLHIFAMCKIIIQSKYRYKELRVSIFIFRIVGFNDD